MLKITFISYSKILKKSFTNIEYHKNINDAKLRASALNWTITEVEEVNE